MGPAEGESVDMEGLRTKLAETARKRPGCHHETPQRHCSIAGL